MLNVIEWGISGSNNFRDMSEAETRAQFPNELTSTFAKKIKNFVLLKKHTITDMGKITITPKEHILRLRKKEHNLPA